MSLNKEIGVLCLRVPFFTPTVFKSDKKQKRIWLNARPLLCLRVSKNNPYPLLCLRITKRTTYDMGGDRGGRITSQHIYQSLFPALNIVSRNVSHPEND